MLYTLYTGPGWTVGCNGRFSPPASQPSGRSFLVIYSGAQIGPNDKSSIALHQQPCQTDKYNAWPLKRPISRISSAKLQNGLDFPTMLFKDRFLLQQHRLMNCIWHSNIFVSAPSFLLLAAGLPPTELG
jgi:hypothetical protein